MNINKEFKLAALATNQYLLKELNNKENYVQMCNTLQCT